MTSELSIFAARLRESITERDRSPVAAAANSRNQSNFQAISPIERAADGDRPRSENKFSELALELFALQFTHNSPYRRICEGRGVSPKTVEHWSQIPAAPTSAFKELELTCLPPAERKFVFHSSGTTEQKPSRHFHSAKSLEIYEASLWSWFDQNIFGNAKWEMSNAQCLMLTPSPSQAPHSSLVHMLDVVRRNLGGASVPASRSQFLGHIGNDNTWTLDFDATLDALNSKPKTQNSKLLLGTAFSFVHLLDFLAEKNLRIQLPENSRVMETGGYKNRSRSMPKAELHMLITERLGVPASHIICEYGMSELSSQAYDSVSGVPSRTTHHAPRTFDFPAWCRLQIISPETGREVADGETGLIRVFDLANVFSVIAIQTEDLAVRRGDGFELIGRAQHAEPRGCSLMTV